MQNTLNEDKRMWILGVNAYHGDSSACLLKGSQLIAAAEEERFRRIKHWAGFPSEAIKYCLSEAGISLTDVARIAINSDPKANFFKKLSYILNKKPSVRMLLDRLQNQRARLSIHEELNKAFPGEPFRGNIQRIEHHLAHLASAFFVSPFEEAVIVSVDGFGDFSSCAWGVGSVHQLSVEKRIYFPHSLGSFYQAMTQHLGFPHYGDEYKVMGLAPYGKPVYMNEMRKIVHLKKDGAFELNLNYFRFQNEDVGYTWRGGVPKVDALYSHQLTQLLGPARLKEESLTQRHYDLARSTQAMYEEAFFNLLNNLYPKYKIENLALAGGCAMNSVANGKIYQNTPFKQVYIQSAAGDAGGAIGAALASYYMHSPDANFKRFVMSHAYWGPSFSNEHVRRIIETNRNELNLKNCLVVFLSEDELFQKTAKAIAEGKVVGWFQGRMEWGPRALGNRSILCDPRRADIKDTLNLKIKHRESFRPFAPSILREAVSDWFETDDDVPFMMKVFKIRAEKREIIPAVTHVDGTGRLQTVYEDTNPRYYRLIQSFNQITNVPIVLNTSFNENEPVVCKPQEALDCFLRTHMDVLVIENCLISRGE